MLLARRQGAAQFAVIACAIELCRELTGKMPHLCDLGHHVELGLGCGPATSQ
jgi:hypothetical protein